ncbi:MAG: putative ubiquitinyl hydrolase, partial [Streblomastix strix]
IQVIENLVSLIVDSRSAAQMEDIQSWEAKVSPCKHTMQFMQALLPIFLNKKIPRKCDKCDISESLWMCLSCGHIGCSRQNYDGSGGKGHGLAHFKENNHPLSVKLGTITPEGLGDVNCYTCDEIVFDRDLSTHLNALGIDASSLLIIFELELELN